MVRIIRLSLRIVKISIRIVRIAKKFRRNLKKNLGTIVYQLLFMIFVRLVIVSRLNQYVISDQVSYNYIIRSVTRFIT